jgi:hypothetical protein
MVLILIYEILKWDVGEILAILIVTFLQFLSLTRKSEVSFAHEILNEIISSLVWIEKLI